MACVAAGLGWDVRGRFACNIGPRSIVANHAGADDLAVIDAYHGSESCGAVTGIALVAGGNVIGALRDRDVIAVATAATGGDHLVVIDRFKGQPR